MSLQRLCDICGRKVDQEVMDYATVSNKQASRDICVTCMSSSLRIVLPGGLTVTGLDALTGSFTPAPPAEPVPYAGNPVTENKPQENDNGNNGNGTDN